MCSGIVILVTSVELDSDFLQYSSTENPSCEISEKKIEILTVPSQYISSLMSFFIENQEKFQTNSSVHNINTRNKHHFHRPVVNLSCFHKGASYCDQNL